MIFAIFFYKRYVTHITCCIRCG